MRIGQSVLVLFLGLGLAAPALAAPRHIIFGHQSESLIAAHYDDDDYEDYDDDRYEDDDRDDHRYGRRYADKYKHKHHQKHFYKHGYGPLPWAPAHGYRRGHGHGGYYDLSLDVQAGHCNRDVLGALIGGAAGGLAGSAVGSGSGQTAAIIGGAVIGLLVGSDIGRTMDRVDHYCIGRALEHGYDGRPVVWNDPDDGRYSVVPTETYRDTAGRYCREYYTTAEIGGRQQQVYGTACRQPDGSWELIN